MWYGICYLFFYEEFPCNFGVLYKCIIVTNVGFTKSLWLKQSDSQTEKANFHSTNKQNDCKINNKLMFKLEFYEHWKLIQILRSSSGY